MLFSSPSVGSLFATAKVFHFFLFSSGSSEWLLTKFLNDLEKKLIPVGGKMSYAHIKETAVKVSVSVTDSVSLEKILADTSAAHSVSLSVRLPAYLLSNKDSFLMELENIASWNNTKLEYDFKQTYLSAKIVGAAQKAFQTRTEIFKIIEKMHGRSPVYVNSHVHGARIVADGGRVYFESKILNTKALISKSQNDYISATSVEGAVYKETLRADRISLSYIMMYLRHILEDILVKNEAYIDEITHENESSIVFISGFCKKLLSDALLEIRMLFISIVSVQIKNIDPYTTAKVFLFEVDSSVTIVGETCEIKKLLREVDLPCEISICIPPAIEEFICGKKNGKINKVSRESDCALSIRKDSNVFVLIQGGSHNAEFSLSLIEDELPTEYSFYLHEKHHKRIIGYGGKSIQRLMKKNGVYIKFDSSTESGNNVIIRTPKKNKDALYKMYKDVMELAGEVPLMAHGAWRPLSFCDFYALAFDTFRFRVDSIEVFHREPIAVQYYFLNDKTCKEHLLGDKTDKEHKNAICTVEDRIVVASSVSIDNSEKITMSTWKNDHTLSNYFLWKYEEPLFSDSAMWSRQWKKFSDSWDNGPWRNSGFTK
ncbi:hypothetical protein NEMIN01_1035 [Nematocida minor]|uniref:uncharacterized protein n=1 Tax=Nematocida minor TaxID=1912983 RepID=UPI002220A8A9|nr:uncharacterized protein NEMIN01_1035 [Nematocida minor]KAI5190411.1 hypothetical protein NEMIN01_1035 [Nematocida minor]